MASSAARENRYGIANINMRDPILYRIRAVSHHQTGDDWPIYPTYDFAHGQEDAVEEYPTRFVRLSLRPPPTV